MTVGEQPWRDTPPWNVLSADERRLGIQGLQPSREVLDVCLAVLDGVAPRLAAMDEAVLPGAWRDEPDVGFTVGLFASEIGHADKLTINAVQVASKSKGPTPLSTSEAQLLVNYILRQQLVGALHFATEHIGKRGHYEVDERLEILPFVRKHWGALNFFKKKDCLQIIAESGRPEVAVDFFSELRQLSDNDPETLALLETQLARLGE